MQHPEICEKSHKNSFKLKEYIFPSGKKCNIQGYENFALDELLYIENIDENDIFTSKMEVPEIWYYDGDKNHRYFTDIYIKSQNKCIEVKSEWTLNLDINVFNLKKESAISSGYVFELRVYNKNKERINKY
jgi:hypothetical protein